LRVGIFVIGAVILVLGLIIVMIYQTPVGAAESILGGWAAVSEDYRQWRSFLSIGQIIVVIGIIIMIPALILKKKSKSDDKPENS